MTIMTIKPTVFVVDDDDTFRQMVRLLLESVEIQVKDFSSAQDFLDQPDLNRPGCVILDLRMPEMDGLELLQALRARLIPLPAIVISAYGEVPTAVRSMQLGAANFLQKPVDHQLLLETVHTLLAEDRRLREEFGDLPGMAMRLERLTPKERQVLGMIIQGKPSKTIAWELGSSVRTIETHRANLMHKLEVRSVADLVRLTLPLRTQLR